MKPMNASPESPSGSKTKTRLPSHSMEVLLEEYAESHQHPVNKRIHYICVPAIFWSILALLWAVKLPVVGTMAVPVSLLVLGYYLWKAPKLAFPLAGFMLFSLALAWWLENNALPLKSIALAVFVLAWIGQFIGHAIEGKKPSFFKDLQFLLVGPAWIARRWLSERSAR